MSEMNRREFAEAVGLAALVPLLRGPIAPLRLPPFTVVAEPGALAQALAAAIRAQYGDRLSEADLAVVTRQIEATLERAEKLRTVHLANGAEPDFVFSAVRGQDIG